MKRGRREAGAAILAQARIEFSRKGGEVKGPSKVRGGPEYYVEMARRSSEARMRKGEVRIRAQVLQRLFGELEDLHPHGTCIDIPHAVVVEEQAKAVARWKARLAKRRRSRTRGA